MTMIERIARRLIELEEDDPDGPTSIADRPARWMLMIEDAESIIALMREPTEAMIDDRRCAGRQAMTDIEAEARAYVEANGHKFADRSTLLFDYVVGLLAALSTANAEIARLRAPPGADVMTLTQGLRDPGDVQQPLLATWQVKTVARALQQYGDERAQEARAAVEKAASDLALDHPDTLGFDLAYMIRRGALTAKPGSDT